MFIAQFITGETQRINDSLKEMLARPQGPSDAEKDAILADIELTLARLQSAISHIGVVMDAGEVTEEMEYDE